MARRRWVSILAWCVGGLLVAYSYAFVSATVTDSEDLSGCSAIVSAVTAKHSVPLSVSQPGRPAVFCDFGVHFPWLRSYYSVFVYGVVDKGEQDAIVRDLRSFHHASQMQRILVRFFEKENWKTWSDANTGASGASRGPELAVNTAWIE